MKISSWIPPIVLYAVSIALCNSVQVGTVLFTTTDLVRRCWTEGEKSILRARLVMQDVLPDPDCIDFSNPKAAVVLLDYFLACFEIISKSSYGKIQNLMYIALSDTLGGYLKAFVLPYVKRAYYAGQIKYSEVEQLFTLYDNIKTFLKTNGAGWAQPRKLCNRKFHVSPLAITGGAFEACKQLHIIEKKGKFHCIRPQSSRRSSLVELKNSKEGYREENLESSKNSKYFPNSVLNRKRSLKSSSPKENTEEGGFRDKVKKINFKCENSTAKSQKVSKHLVKISTNETKECLEDSGPSESRKESYEDRCPHCGQSRASRRVIIPLPMLDDCRIPQSIIVPFQDRPLRNLHSASSAFILEYYYIAVIKCFIAKGNTRTEIKNFNTEFHSWLDSKVLPHLNDEQWYPGFGGVLRIVETVKKFGENSGLNEPSLHDTSYAFEKGVEFEVRDTWNKAGKNQTRKIVECKSSLNTKRHVITAILVVSLLWIFIFCACAFYSQATRGRDLLYEKGSEQGSNQPQWKPRAKSINFHFFIKFFKKQEENELKPCDDNKKPICLNIRKLKNQNPLEKKFFGGKNQEKTHIKKKLDFKLDDEPREVIYGQGDFSDFGHSKQEEPFKPILPHWPSHTYFAKTELNPEAESAGDANPAKGREPGDKVTLLWKKPSVKFRRKSGFVCSAPFRSPSRWKAGHLNINTELKTPFEEDPDKKSPSETTTPNLVERSLYSYSASAEDSKNSTSKQNLCSCCSDSCQHTHTSCTHCSSHTQTMKQLSSATTEFSEDVTAESKPYTKNVTPKTTEDSDCDDEISTSSENDY